MKKTVIICDGCEKDITFTGSVWSYNLVLYCYPVASNAKVVCDKKVTPPIDEDKYFCDLGCLKKWLGDK